MNEDKRNPVHITLSENLSEKFDIFSKKQNKNKSRIIEIVLNKYIKEKNGKKNK